MDTAREHVSATVTSAGAGFQHVRADELSLRDTVVDAHGGQHGVDELRRRANGLIRVTCHDQWKNVLEPYHLVTVVRRAASPVTVRLSIENVYDDGVVVTDVLAAVPPPPTDPNELDEWAIENLHRFTGTGRRDGDAGYEVTVVESTEPTLVGRRFEWY